MLHIFDIDGTIADSKHRQNTLLDGSLDLSHWRKNSTPEKIALDQLLPLAYMMRESYRAGDTVCICTARVMSQPDWDWLERHRLHFHHAMYRREGDTRPDAELKRDKIWDLLFNKLRRLPGPDVVLYDDNQTVLTMGRDLGLTVVDATVENATLIKAVSYI